MEMDFCLVVFVDKIAYYNVMYLAVPMTSSYSLLNSLWVPWQIIIEYQITELQIQAFGARFGRDEDFQESIIRLRWAALKLPLNNPTRPANSVCSKRSNR
jgi:hypothetical protein